MSAVKPLRPMTGPARPPVYPAPDLGKLPPAANNDVETGLRFIDKVKALLPSPQWAGRFLGAVAFLLPSNFFLKGTEQKWEDHNRLFQNLSRFPFQERALIDLMASSFPEARQKLERAIQHQDIPPLQEMIEEAKKRLDFSQLQQEAEQRWRQLMANGEAVSFSSLLWNLAWQYRGGAEFLFAGPTAHLHSDIWQASPTLRGFTFPDEESDDRVREAIHFLRMEKAAIEREVGKDLSYGALMHALVSGGAIRGDTQRYLMAGTALSLASFPANPVGDLSPGALATPEAAAKWLRDHAETLQPLLKRIGDNPYATLMEALIWEGKTSGEPGPFRKAGRALDRYFPHRNPMQGLAEGHFKKPETALAWLVQHKKELDQKLGPHSLDEWMDVLVYAGKTTGEPELYRSAVNAASEKPQVVAPVVPKSASKPALAPMPPAIKPEKSVGVEVKVEAEAKAAGTVAVPQQHRRKQRVGVARYFATPKEAAVWLRQQKENLDKKHGPRSCEDWMLFLAEKGRLMGEEKAYRHAGKLLDLHFALGNATLGLIPMHLRTPGMAVEWLRQHKQELDAQLGLRSYAEWVQMLVYAGKTKGDSQNYLKAGRALDLYFFLLNMAPELGSKEFATPAEAVEWLREKKPDLDARLDGHSYREWMEALVYGGRARGNIVYYWKAADRLDKPEPSSRKRSCRRDPICHAPLFTNPGRAATWLQKHKPALDGQMGIHSFADWMQKLIDAGRTKGDPEKFLEAGRSLDIASAPGNPVQVGEERRPERNVFDPMKRLGPGHFATPKEVAKWLIEKGPDLSRVHGIYSYKEWMNRLADQGYIVGDRDLYLEAGRLLDLHVIPGNATQGLVAGHFRTPKGAAKWLTENKAALDRQIGSHSYHALMLLLFYAGKLRGSSENFFRAGRALDLYFTPNNLMQKAVLKENTKLEEALAWLEHCRAILNETIGVQSDTLRMDALFYGKELDGDLHEFHQAVAATGESF